MIFIISLIVIVVLIGLYVFITYNKLTKMQNRVDEAFSTMDVYLKKRWDLIPSIVETVKGYAAHEKSTLEEVISLRSGNYESLDSESKLNVNGKLQNRISRLMILAETYPNLKANENFLNLSKELSSVEDEIANSRKYYNAVVRLMNNMVESFPSNIIASMFKFKTYKMFEATSSEREVVKVEL